MRFSEPDNLSVFIHQFFDSMASSIRFSPFAILLSGIAIPFLSSPSLSAQDAEKRKIDFLRDVKPIFEGACVQCHRPDSDEKNGGYFMDTKEGTFKGGDAYGEDVINVDDVNDSPVYWMTTVHYDDPEDPEAMPPKRPLNDQQIQIIHDWIEQGAEWPDGEVLSYSPRVIFGGVKATLLRGAPFSYGEVEMLRYWADQGADWPKDTGLKSQGGDLADDINLTGRIREAVLSGSKEKAEADMKAYQGTIPKTGVNYEMVAIPGGEFLMGSPDAESARSDDEGPQRKVKVSPFWMGKFEVTWDMYEPFMITDVARNKDGSPISIPPDAEDVDIVSAPTTPYVEMSFGMGTTGFPAISMTQHAANKFCQWLSAQTGHFYRLPTEAEWEYACRAGSEGPFHCPEEELADYAVYDPEQNRRGYEKVGSKKPNPLGLYDMHGNILEWCLDGYSPDYSHLEEGKTHENPWMKPERLYPRVARGGSWYDTSEWVRSAARSRSEENWKSLDPQLPKSIWYHTDTPWLGFRIVRPLEVPDVETMHEMWNIGIRDKDEGAVFSLLAPGEDPVDFEKVIKPLLERGGPFSPEEIEQFRTWTRDGARWPEEVELDLGS